MGIIEEVINTEFWMDSIISCFKVDNGIFKHVEIIDGVINWGVCYVLNESNTELFSLGITVGSIQLIMLHEVDTYPLNI